MLRGLKILSVLLALLLAAPVLRAQISGNLSLHHTKSDSDRIIHSPESGEFKLSLGSQLFSSEDNIQQNNFSETVNPAKIEVAENFSDLNSVVYLNQSDFRKESQLKLKNRRKGNIRKLSTTLTLNNSYSDQQTAVGSPADDGLKISTESGRLQIYGEYQQSQVPQIKATDFFQPNGQPLKANIRASISEPGAAGESEPTDKNAAMASRYYLEAVYSFKPTLKGKVSFKRSMIDTFESEEQLQVEGIVEANRNILIKAGYNNEVRPEISEPRSNKDTKVWTEFILKF